MRQNLATETQEGGDLAKIAPEAKVSENTIHQGTDPSSRSRLKTANRYRSDPESRFGGVTGAQEGSGEYDPSHLAAGFTKQQHRYAQRSIDRFLKAEGYSLKVAKKNREDTTHPDRDPQFQDLSKQWYAFKTISCPIISVDCTKKDNCTGIALLCGDEIRKRGMQVGSTPPASLFSITE